VRLLAVVPPNPRLQRTRSASPPSPLSRQALGALGNKSWPRRVACACSELVRRLRLLAREGPKTCPLARRSPAWRRGRPRLLDVVGDENRIAAHADREAEKVPSFSVRGEKDRSRCEAAGPPAGVVIAGGKAALEVLRSKNGTFLNGKQIRRRMPLTDGDEVRIGPETMVFRMMSRGRTTQTE
jgi:hypothetical protein